MTAGSIAIKPWPRRLHRLVQPLAGTGGDGEGPRVHRQLADADTEHVVVQPTKVHLHSWLKKRDRDL